MDPFLSEEEWKITREFERALGETFRLSTTYQNAEKLNSPRVLAMRKTSNEILSRDVMSLADVDD